MRAFILKGFVVFVILLVATSVMMDTMNTQFGSVDFFKKHGIFFLIFVTIFPRLTLLFSSVATGGFLWWLGFFFCPRILVASLATVSYFHTNPILVVVSWLVAIGGETMEKAGLSGRKRFVFRTYNMNQDPPAKPIQGGDIIEAEFTKKS